MVSYQTDWQLALKDIQQEFPDAKVVDKADSKLMKFMSFFSLSGRKDFLEHSATVIGHTIYMPDQWSGWSKAETVYHERIHMRQAKRYTYPGFLFLYLLCLPVGLTMRGRLEMEAYKESMRFHAKYGTITDSYIEWLVGLFSGPLYFFMDVRKAKVRAELEKARREINSNL